MNKVLSILLILLGIAEIIIAVMDVKMPILVAVFMGIVFVALGVKTLVDIGKKE